VINDYLQKLKKDKLSLLSACGSIASIIALTIVLLDKTMINSKLGPQTESWRFILFVIALVGTAGAIIFTYHWVRQTFEDPNKSKHTKIFYAILRIIIGLIILGICIDGIFAALYWRLWLYDLVRFSHILNAYHY